MIGRARLPTGLTFGELRIGQFYVKYSGIRVDLDDIAVPQKRDRPTHGRFRPDMADAEPAGSPRKPAVSDERDFAAHALPGQRRRGREHFAHAGTAARPFIANHTDFAFLVGLLLDRLEGILFAIEAAGRTGKFQIRHARDLHDCALGREIALQANHTAGDSDRLVGGPHHILVRIPFHTLEVFGDRSASYR